MALTLTSKDIKRDIAQLAHGAGMAGASASVGTIAGLAIGKSSRSKVLPFVMLAGGGALALKGRGKMLPYAGVGLAIGSMWSLLQPKSTRW